MGLSSKKTTTNSSTNTNTSMTPVNQPYVNNALSGLTGQIMDLSKIDPQSLVAGPNQYHDAAGQTLSGLGAGNASYGQAGTLFNSAANGGAAAYNPAMMDPVANMTGAQASPFIQQYMSPYTQDVVKASLADYDFGAGQTQAQNKLALANDSTFGGSGGAIQTSMSNDAINRGRGTLSANLNNQGFQTALDAAQSDANRAQQANLTNYQGALTTSGANQNANNNAWQFNAGQQDNSLNRMLQAGQGLTGLGTAQDANTRANATSQTDLAQILRQIQQQKAGAGVNLLSTQAGLFGSLPLDLQKGLTGTTSADSTSTTKSSPSMMDSIQQALQVAAAAAAFSDERLKADIETIGHDAKGRRWVNYRYLWDEPGTRRRGVIAQEVAKSDPHAVSTHESGYLMVNYGDLA